jgi:hypothetical protein
MRVRIGSEKAKSVHRFNCSTLVIPLVFIVVLTNTSQALSQQAEDSAPEETTTLTGSDEELASGSEGSLPVGMTILGAGLGMGIGINAYWGFSQLLCDDGPCLSAILTGFIVIPVATALGAMIGAGRKRNVAGAFLGTFGGVLGASTLLYGIMRGVDTAPGDLSERGSRALLYTTVGVLLGSAGIGAVYGSIHGWDDERDGAETDDGDASHPFTLRAGLAPMPGGVMAVLGGEI